MDRRWESVRTLWGRYYLQLKIEVQMVVDKIKMLTSEVAVKYMEVELVKIEHK